jgi:dTDP-4-dehydrorhamnose reductase
MVTGANGMLDLALVEALQDVYQVIQIRHQSQAFDAVRGTGRSADEKIFEVDLSDPAECRNMIAIHKPDIVVHAAEYTDLDYCESMSSARWLNIESARMLAGALSLSGRFVYISSGQVFDGGRGPYREKDERNPVNTYGAQKVAAEDLVRTRKNSLIVRVPQLIGREPEDQPGLLSSMMKAIDTRESGKLDDVCHHSPTWSVDVAEAVRFLLTRDAVGIFHAACPDGGTLYDLTQRLADFTGQSLAHKKPSSEIIKPCNGARRPVNNQLLSQKLLELGFPGFHSFADTLVLLADQGLIPGELAEH